MSVDVIARLAAVCVLVAANGFFVAAEFALVTVRRSRIEQLANEGHLRAKVVRTALVHLDRYIAGTQVGITLASLALGWIGEPAIAGLIIPVFETFAPGVPPAAVHTTSVVFAFTLITFMHVILGELVPKSLALQKPEATSLAVSHLLRLAIIAFQPLIWSLNGLGNLLLHAIGLHAAAGHESVHSAQELELLVRESHKAGVLDDLEIRMLQRTFRFSETTVAEIMVPRLEMTAIDLNLPLEEIFDVAASAKHSRLPCYYEDIDQIEGVLFIHDLFGLLRQKRASLKDLVRTPLFVPEAMHLDNLVERFRVNNMQMAIVVDEHGGTAGLITLENIIEAVFGKIQDQNEETSPDITAAPDGTLTVRGETRLVELAEQFGWRFDDTDVDTVGGFLMHKLGLVPKIGDKIVEGGRQLQVTKMDRNRVSEVVIKPI